MTECLGSVDLYRIEILNMVTILSFEERGSCLSLTRNESSVLERRAHDGELYVYKIFDNRFHLTYCKPDAWLPPTSGDAASRPWLDALNVRGERVFAVVKSRAWSTNLAIPQASESVANKMMTMTMTT
jgi:hypothetical protein